MKKAIPFLVILLCVLAFTISFADAEGFNQLIPEEEIITEARLPTSLVTIEDEAFEGTALVKVELPEGVETIGEHAFANISTLCNIQIPKTTSYIASSTFEGSNRTTITAPGNSYARTWAKNHGLPFSSIVMFCASSQGPSIQFLASSRSTEVIDTQTESDNKPGTQWRRIEEINVTRTEELIANHVQGRSPPMA